MSYTIIIDHHINKVLNAEQTLIENCLKGDKKSQYLLVKQYSPMIMSICKRYAHDQAMAKDILQEALILVFRHIDKFEYKGSFEGWIRKITARASLQWVDKKWYKNEQHLVGMLQEQSIDRSNYIYHDANHITDMISSLPEKYKVVFNLFVVDEFNHKEISEMLNIKETTSRSHLLRARKMLQKKYTRFIKTETVNKKAN